jgi:hypothetical protein
MKYSLANTPTAAGIKLCLPYEWNFLGVRALITAS